MNGRCETDHLDQAVDVCDSCYGEFCDRCLVWPKGRRHPVCTECALIASGVRTGERPPPLGSRRTAKKRRKALKASVEQTMTGADTFAYFDGGVELTTAEGATPEPNRPVDAPGPPPPPDPAAQPAIDPTLTPAASGPEEVANLDQRRDGLTPPVPAEAPQAEPTTPAVAKLNQIREGGARYPLPERPAAEVTPLTDRRTPQDPAPDHPTPDPTLPPSPHPTPTPTPHLTPDPTPHPHLTPDPTLTPTPEPAATDPAWLAALEGRTPPPPEDRRRVDDPTSPNRPRDNDGVPVERRARVLPARGTTHPGRRRTDYPLPPEGVPAPTAPMVGEVRTIGGRRQDDVTDPEPMTPPPAPTPATVTRAASGANGANGAAPADGGGDEGGIRADTDPHGNWIPPILRGLAPDAREAGADLPQRRRTDVDTGTGTGSDSDVDTGSDVGTGTGGNSPG